ncbi:hypothetical protein MBM09_10015 [Flaviramulus sp. BrNp1-15]|uniref:hypothetical protein n=1 Tax=Flaviramulus sp. BrNp1-15 TaxID=2916754 RepID=UPI001EE792F0|nr:hypothetical protein [Flaviramulus sp. BrNp1-15]ULC58254.1 hypothetical protein MBM09_10015 [Flaviramulus sp. BrNp1-15]
MTKEKSRYLDKETSKNYGNKKELLVGSIIATFIAITPFLVTLWQSVPSQKTWNTFFGSITSNYYEDVQVLAWTLIGRIIPLFLMFIWIFTNRHWWYHVILIPISMYIYQIIEILNDEILFTETNQILYLLPVMAIVVPSIYLIRARIFNRINEANKSLEELEEEFKISPKNFWGKVKEYF